MAYGRTEPSMFDSFTLYPLPYPVLLILLMVFFFLSLSWFFSYEDFVEETEETISWALLLIPVVLVLVIRWLSSIERFEDTFLGSLLPYDRRTNYYYHQPQEGSSPWGVAAVVILLLILISYQSTFLDMWKL